MIIVKFGQLCNIGTNCFMSMKSMFAFKDSKHIFFHGNTHIAFLVALFVFGPYRISSDDLFFGL